MIEINTLKLNKKIKNKYSIENNTFSFKPKDIDKDRIETEIGDIKQPEFYPQVKIKRWDNEVNFSVRLKHEEENPIITSNEEKINWKGDKVEVDFYDIKEGEGGYEFEITLKEKPKSNKVEFSLNTKGLNFYYQPELTQEEIDNGDRRPENVIGSYAVYCSEEKINYVGGKEYKTGKVAHIYRPKIEDANGSWVWGKLNIDKEKGILSVEIPQEFLDNATYPIRHAAGLTVGYTSAGATSVNFSYGMLYGTKATGASGTAESMTAYGAQYESLGYARFGAYLNDNSLAGYTNEVTFTSSASWKTANFTSPFSLSAVDYRLVFLCGREYDSFYKDTVDPGYTYGSNTGAYPAFPNPHTYLNLNSSTTKYSIYLTYSVISGPANVKTYKGLASASVKTCKGLAIASVKTKKGLN